MHHATPRFWECFEKLPEPVQDLAQKSFELLKTNPSHPSLRFKKVGRFWSARVGSSYRALAVKDDSDYIWVWIGDHDQYDRLIG
jgi:hypothetical protein